MRIASWMRALPLLALACRHPHAAGPLRQEAYVWQRKVNAITNIPDACPADTRVVRKEEE